MEVAVGCGGVGLGRSLKGRFHFPSFLPLDPDEMLPSFATQSSMRENGVFIMTVEEREGAVGGGRFKREGGLRCRPGLPGPCPSNPSDLPHF